MTRELDRRTLLRAGGTALVASTLGGAGLTAPLAPEPERKPMEKLAIRLAVKYSMVAGDAAMVDKFKLLARLGYDGVELDSPNDFAREEVLAARDESGLRIHGVVDSVHWQKRLSSPDEEVRAEGRRALETAIEDSYAYGGSSVLLVPGRVADAERENQEQAWERSITELRKVLPLAANLGIHVLIENVWNGFCYEHDGPADQTADRLAEYLDAIGSPWVGSYFDIGNHRKYGVPSEWARTLGRRIVKLDVKDWGVENGWAKIGEGDVDWEPLCGVLREIGFTGWATAEVGGGDEARLKEIRDRMVRVFGL